MADRFYLVIYFVKLNIGNGASGRADRFAIHLAHKTDECASKRSMRENIGALIVKFGSGKRDKAHVVRACLNAQLP